MNLSYVVESEVLIRAKVFTKVDIEYDPEEDDLNSCIKEAIEHQSWGDVDDYDIEEIYDVIDIINKEKLD